MSKHDYNELKARGYNRVPVRAIRGDFVPMSDNQRKRLDAEVERHYLKMYGVTRAVFQTMAT